MYPDHYTLLYLNWFFIMISIYSLPQFRHHLKLWRYGLKFEVLHVFFFHCFDFHFFFVYMWKFPLKKVVPLIRSYSFLFLFSKICRVNCFKGIYWIHLVTWVVFISCTIKCHVYLVNGFNWYTTQYLKLFKIPKV